MASRHGRVKDVSCLALTFFYDYLEAHSIPRRRLQDGLRYSPEHLDNRLNWIDYATFLEIERRMDALFPEDPNLFFTLGSTLDANRGFGFLRPLFRAVVSPYQMYTRLPSLTTRFLFPFVEMAFTREPRGLIHAHYRFKTGYVPSDAFFETARGMMTSVPRLMGFPPALVRWRRINPQEAIFDIEVQEAAGAIERAVALPRRLSRTVRLWWGNFSEALVELEETNHLLQEKVDALTEAKSELDHKVRELTVLNALANATTSELDVHRLTGKVVGVVSELLGGIAAAVLLAEGDAPKLVIASSAALRPEQLAELRALAEAQHPLTRAIVHNRRTVPLRLENGRLLCVPMVSRERVVAALVLGLSDEDRLETKFLESMASQIAVALDNAISYQTITDLRDNLEKRVRERTAELEEARGQLEDTVSRLQRSDHARNEFFTNVSHELRTPLTLMMAPLDELEITLGDAATADMRANLRHIRDNAQALLRLINEILDFARLDNERMPADMGQADLAGLVADVVQSFAPLAERRRLELSFHAPEGEVAAEIDARLMRRACINLLVNAIKYSDEGCKVEVRAGQADGEAFFEVQDDGPGIPAEHHERIFERFHRVLDARGRTIEGSGIGLAMVKDIAQLHRGRIALTSEPNRGACFRVVLPLHAEWKGSKPGARLPRHDRTPEPLITEELVLPAASPLELPARRGIESGRLLLVEDNPQMRDFMTRLFARRFRVISVADGVQALQVASSELPEAVVTDVMMPRMDGYELCRRLKADPVTRNIPVILVSARHGPESALEGFAAGADDFVVKPFSSPELMARVSAQIRLRAMSLAMLRMEKQTTLGLMAAGIAHEVLNPVNAVVNAVPSLRKLGSTPAMPAEQQRMVGLLLDTVEKSGQRIANVVRAVLAFARQDRNGMQMREASLVETIDSVLTVLGHRLDGRVQIHKRYNWEGTVNCIPELLGQVFMNLLANAADAVGQRAGNVTVTVDRVDGNIVVCVRDDGPGIAPDQRERIFDAFFTTKAPGAGTGLGLALARDIATLHGGTLELNKDLDVGAEFILTLPQRTATMPALAACQNGVFA